MDRGTRRLPFAIWLSALVLCVARADQVDHLVTAEMQRQYIPGASIAVVKHGKIVKQRGYGLANLEHAVPVNGETVFQSGSIGKQFTAALTMLLVQDGRLGLDKPISSYLAGTPHSWSSITVRHLLNHTSGLPSTDKAIDLRRDYSDQELLDSMSKIPLRFAPGERWGYSNLGYQLLGILCTRVGGEFYGDQLRARIFEPSRMSASIISERNLVPHRASGYDRVNGKFMNQSWVAQSLSATADGGLYLTARDLARWSIALDGDTLLSRSIKEAMWTPATLSDGSGTEYGFGWELVSIKGHRVAQHGGAWQGFTGQITRYLDDELTIIVLTNRSRARPQFIVEKLVGEYIPDLKMSLPRAQTFASVPMFLRGTMNKWSVRDAFRRTGERHYEVEIDLEPGEYAFRVAADDWTTIDLGAPFDDPLTQLRTPAPLEFRGENLILKAQEASTYAFRLDVSEPQRPTLTVGPQVSE